MRGFDRVNQVGDHPGFDDVAERADRKRFPHVVGIFMNGQEDDLHSRIRSRQLPHHFDPAHSRHRYIRDQNIGPQAFALIQSCLAIVYGTNNVELKCQHTCNRGQESPMIVC